MTKPVKMNVYSWIDTATKSRCIIAANTKKEVGELCGRPESWVRNLRQTYDPYECDIARRMENCTFRRPMHEPDAPFVQF